MTRLKKLATSALDDDPTPKLGKSAGTLGRQLIGA